MALSRGLRREASRSDNTSADASLPRYESVRGLLFDELVESGVDLVNECLHEAGGGQVQGQGGLCLKAEGLGEGG